MGQTDGRIALFQNAPLWRGYDNRPSFAAWRQSSRDADVRDQ